MGEANADALNQWEYLCVYITDGRLNIDNNSAEKCPARCGHWPQELPVCRQ